MPTNSLWEREENNSKIQLYTTKIKIWSQELKKLTYVLYIDN